MIGSPSFSASGDIYPSRFVTITGNNLRVSQAVAANSIIGISQEGTRRYPDVDNTFTGFAARAGEPISVYGNGHVNVPLELGGTVTAGQFIQSDANGKGVVSTGAVAHNIGAIALQSGVSGDVIKVYVFLNPARP